MPIIEVDVFDPPVGSEITIQVTITNTGTVAGDFYVHAVTGIDPAEATLGAIAQSENFQFFNAIAATVDLTTTVPALSGDLGIVTLEGGESTSVQFLSVPLDVPGLYSVGVHAGTFDIAANQIIEEEQDFIFVPDVIDIFIPATAEITEFEVVA